MVGGNCRKQVSSFKRRCPWETLERPVFKHLSPTVILKALDRKIRQAEKKEKSCKTSKNKPRDVAARRSASVPTNRRLTRKTSQPQPSRDNFQPKGILRKTCSSTHQMGYGFGDTRNYYSEISPCPPRQGFSMCEIEGEMSGKYDSFDYYTPNVKLSPPQKLPQKVRFQTGLKKKAKVQKNNCRNVVCHSNNSKRGCMDEPNVHNYPAYNLSSNKPTTYDWQDLTPRWGNFTYGNDTLRKSNRRSYGRGSGDSRGPYAFISDKFSSDKFSADKFSTNKFSSDKYNTDPYNLDKYAPDKYTMDDDQSTWSSVFSSCKAKPYYNPNFEKLDSLINVKKPLDNIDSLINKYGCTPGYTSTFRTSYLDSSKYSSNYGSSCSQPYESKAKNYWQPRSDSLLKGDPLGVKPSFEKNYYLSGSFANRRQYTSGLDSRLVSRSSSASNQHKNFSENNLTRDNSKTCLSPIKKTSLSIASPYNQSPIKNGKTTNEASGYLESASEVENNEFPGENQRQNNAGSGSEYEGDRTGTPTIESSKISIDLDEETEKVNECYELEADPIYIREDGSPERARRSPKESSAGSASPLVFESTSSSYENLLDKYKNPNGSKCQTWRPQSKVLQAIFQDEYDGPWSRKKRFAPEPETEKPAPETPSISVYSKKNSELDSVQDLINMVHGNLADVSYLDIQRKEQENRFDISELQRRMSKLAMNRF